MVVGVWLSGVKSGSNARACRSARLGVTMGLSVDWKRAGLVGGTQMVAVEPNNHVLGGGEKKVMLKASV